jgi:predicted CXXCH cytochrome family protein
MVKSNFYLVCFGGVNSMPNRKKTSSKPGGRPVKKPYRKPFPWLTLAVPGAVVLVLVIGSFTFAANMEEKDSFCASCHTQPESTFYQRSQAGKTVDLATFHRTKNTKCIDCHSGSGVTGRMGAILLGSRNAFAYFTRTAKQPAPLTVAISDTNCVKCHPEAVNGQPDVNNHFHLFLPRWQAADPNAASCVTCHSSHTTDGDAQIGYLNQQKTEQVCQQCHNALGQ